MSLAKRLTTGVELVAVGAGEPLDALLAQDRIEPPTRAAVGVGHEDRLVAAAGGADLALDRRRDAVRAGCGAGRQAGHLEVLEARPAGQLDELAGERATADDEDARLVVVGRR